MLKHGFEFSHRADPLAARELVDLGCDDRAIVHHLLEPCPRLRVALEAGMTAVDEEEARNVRAG